MTDLSRNEAAATDLPRTGFPRVLERLRGLAANRLWTSSAAAFFVLVSGAGVSYFAQVMTARIVGPEGFGLYMLAIAWMVMLATLSTLGLHVSLLRLIPTYGSRKDWPAMKGVIRFALLRVGSTGLFVTACALTVTLAVDLDRQHEATLLIALAASPLVAMQLVGAAVVRAFGGVVSALAPERLGRDSIAVAVLAALVGLGLAPATAPTASIGMMVSGIAILALILVLAWRYRPAELDAALPTTADADWLRPALPLTVIMGADLVMARSGVIVLGLFGDARGAGIFAVAFSLSAMTALPRMAVAAAFAPTVASLHAQGDRAGLQALTARAARLSLAGAFCVGLPLLVALPALLGFFGPEFIDGWACAAVLMAGQLVAAAAGPQQHLMTMTGREKAGATMHAGGALIGLALCFALTGPFGILGTAVAIATGVVVWNLAMAWFVFARLGLRPGLLAASAAFS